MIAGKQGTKRGGYKKLSHQISCIKPLLFCVKYSKMKTTFYTNVEFANGEI